MIYDYALIGIDFELGIRCRFIKSKLLTNTITSFLIYVSVNMRKPSTSVTTFIVQNSKFNKRIDMHRILSGMPFNNLMVMRPQQLQ